MSRIIDLADQLINIIATSTQGEKQLARNTFLTMAKGADPLEQSVLRALATLCAGRRIYRTGTAEQVLAELQRGPGRPHAIAKRLAILDPAGRRAVLSALAYLLSRQRVKHDPETGQYASLTPPLRAKRHPWSGRAVPVKRS